jgi:hypothetical protein
MDILEVFIAFSIREITPTMQKIKELFHYKPRRFLGREEA